MTEATTGMRHSEEMTKLDKRNLYRLPWSKNDNPIAWLEVTDVCDLACEGCYRQKLTGHKPLEEIKEEVRFFKKWRNPDSVSIAGGEPMLHPQILDIVAFIAENRIKPIILTNAMKLTPELLRELKRAGLAGFTIHIDSHQSRPGWTGKNEIEHNELRQHYADMIAAEKGLTVIFNSTVYPSTSREIPGMVRWAQANVTRVNGMVFITYRTLTTETSAALDSTGCEVDATKLGYASTRFEDRFVAIPDVDQLIHDACPVYEACSYLGGTVRHDTYKWLAAVTVGSRNRVYGSVGRAFMEFVQVFHHLFRGTYVAYTNMFRVTPFMFVLAPWDRPLRAAAGSWFRDVVRHPNRLFTPLRLQSLGVIQAPDPLPGGQLDMCDSCPDMTVWNGLLINSCRLDEYRLFGDLLTVVDRSKLERAAGANSAQSSGQLAESAKKKIPGTQ
jgi:pyruvate-formate lyase-activating enzyme